jgi:hypothetical protein
VERETVRSVEPRHCDRLGFGLAVSIGIYEPNHFAGSRTAGIHGAVRADRHEPHPPTFAYSLIAKPGGNVSLPWSASWASLLDIAHAAVAATTMAVSRTGWSSRSEWSRTAWSVHAFYPTDNPAYVRPLTGRA